MPTLFGDFGKKNNDLFSKKYDFTNSFKIINKTSSGVELESALKGGQGTVKTTMNCPKHGKAEVTVSSAAKPLVGAKFTTEKLCKGLKLVVSGNEGLKGGVDADYQKDNFTASTKIALGAGAPVVTVAGSFGLDGVTIGGEAILDSGSQAVKEFGAGWQYAQKDFTGTIRTRTSDKSDTVTASYFFTTATGSQVGTSYQYDLNKNASSVQVGTEFKYGADTVVKAKANSAGVVTTAIEHVLREPLIKVNAAFEFGAGFQVTNFTPAKFGFGFTCGDF